MLSLTKAHAQKKQHQTSLLVTQRNKYTYKYIVVGKQRQLHLTGDASSALIGTFKTIHQVIQTVLLTDTRAAKKILEFLLIY